MFEQLASIFPSFFILLGSKSGTGYMFQLDGGQRFNLHSCSSKHLVQIIIKLASPVMGDNQGVEVLHLVQTCPENAQGAVSF